MARVTVADLSVVSQGLAVGRCDHVPLVLILYYCVLGPRAAWRSALVSAIAEGVVADEPPCRRARMTYLFG